MIGIVVSNSLYLVLVLDHMYYLFNSSTYPVTRYLTIYHSTRRRNSSILKSVSVSRAELGLRCLRKPTFGIACPCRALDLGQRHILGFS